MGAVFSWTYAFCQLPAGYLIDKIGPRRMYFISMGMWSFATALMAFGHNMAQFLTFRFLLGIGESPTSPNSSKIATQWFPREERDRKSTRLNSSHVAISYAVFCLKKKTNVTHNRLTIQLM